VTIHLKPSRRLTLLLIAAHCAVAPLVWLLVIPDIIKFVILFLLLISLYYYLNQDALLRFASSVVSLKLTGSRRCELEMHNGNTLDCIILEMSYVSASLTVLILQPPQNLRSRSLVIFPDNIDKEEFRRLRVMLHWKLGEKI